MVLPIDPRQMVLLRERFGRSKEGTSAVLLSQMVGLFHGTLLIPAKTFKTVSNGKLPMKDDLENHSEGEDHGYSYEWVLGQKPRLTKEVKTIICNTDNFVPLVVPGLSTNSGSKPSSTSTLQDLSPTKQVQPKSEGTK